MASSCSLRSILFLSSPTNLRSNYSYSASFLKNHLTCSLPTASRFESFSFSSIGTGSSRRLSTTRRKVRSMATKDTGKEEKKKRVEIYDLEENLAIDLAKFTADLSDKFCKEKGSFTVVVSGGSLIKSLRWVCYIINLWFFRIETIRFRVAKLRFRV